MGRSDQVLYKETVEPNEREAEISITDVDTDHCMGVKGVVTMKPSTIAALDRIIIDYPSYVLSLAHDRPPSWAQVRSDRGTDLKEGEWDGYKGMSMLDCQNQADKNGVYYYAWRGDVYQPGFCKVQKQEIAHPNLTTNVDGYKLWAFETHPKWCVSSQGNDLKEGEWDWFPYVEQNDCQSHADKAGVDYYAWTSEIYSPGACKVLKPLVDNPDLSNSTLYGYQLWEYKASCK